MVSDAVFVRASVAAVMVLVTVLETFEEGVDVAKRVNVLVLE